MGRRHSDLHFHHTVCVGCRLILRHNPSIRPALGADDAFPRMCMLYKSRCAWLFFRVLWLSDLFNPIRGSHSPFSQSLFSPVPIQLFWGLFYDIHLTQDSLFNDSPHTLPPQWRVGGGRCSQYSLMRLSFRKMPALSLQHQCGVPRTISEKQLLLSLSLSLLQRVSTFHGLFYAFPRGAPVCGSSHCPSLLSIKMLNCFCMK